MRNTATYPRIQFPLLMVDTFIYDRFLKCKMKKQQIISKLLIAKSISVHILDHSQKYGALESQIILYQLKAKSRWLNQKTYFLIISRHRVLQIGSRGSRIRWKCFIRRGPVYRAFLMPTTDSQLTVFIIKVVVCVKPVKSNTTEQNLQKYMIQ